MREHISGTSQEKELWINSGLNACLKHGITAVHSIEGAWPEYERLAREKKLPIRVFYSALDEQPYSADFPRPGQACGVLSCDRVKIFADGGLGGATAALSVPYKGQTQSGLLLQSQVALRVEFSRVNSVDLALQMCFNELCRCRRYLRPGSITSRLQSGD